MTPRPVSTRPDFLPPSDPSPQGEESDLPGFRTPPAAPDAPSASLPPETSPDPWSASEADSATGQPDAKSEPASAPSTKRSRVSTDPTAFVGLFQTLIAMISLFLHNALAPKHVENDVWVADQDDLDAIAAPLSRIAARHSPLDGGVAGDVGDGIEAAVAVTGYAVKNMSKAKQVRSPYGQQLEHDAPVAEPVAETPRGPFG